MKHLLSQCKKFFLAGVVVLPAWTFSQIDAPEPAGPPADATPGHHAEERHTATFEVVAVDAAKRLITLREEGEEPQTYGVNPEVRNLDQVKPGDRVKVDYHASTSIRILPPGELVDSDIAILQRSQPGEKPGGQAARTRTVTATVSSVFPESKEFLTRNEKGRLRTWKVRDAKELENIHSGDRVQLTYTSALVISVAPAPTTATAPTTAAAKTGPASAPTPAAEPETP